MTHVSMSRRTIMGVLVAGAAVSTMELGIPGTALAEKGGQPGFSGSKFDDAIRRAYDQYRSLNEGKNADYIPALAQVPSGYFGIAMAGADGKVREVGDSKELFSIQSICKVFNAALVMQQSGDQKIEDSVGVDATGQVFNSITAIDEQVATNGSIGERQRVGAATEVSPHVAVDGLACQVDRNDVAGATQVNTNSARNTIDRCNHSSVFRHLVAVGIKRRNDDSASRVARYR